MRYNNKIIIYNTCLNKTKGTFKRVQATELKVKIISMSWFTKYRAIISRCSRLINKGIYRTIWAPQIWQSKTGMQLNERITITLTMRSSLWHLKPNPMSFRLCKAPGTPKIANSIVASRSISNKIPRGVDGLRTLGALDQSNIWMNHFRKSLGHLMFSLISPLAKFNKTKITF